MGPAADPVDRLGLTGRWVWVAGATGLVGSAVAGAAAARGADVVVHAGHDGAAAAESAQRLRDRHGVRAVDLRGDITTPGEVARLREAAAKAGVDAVAAVVNCVTGYSGKPTSVEELDDQEFRDLLDTDLLGPHSLVRDLLPLLAARGAQVVLLSSLAGLRGRPGAPHLCAAKAGVRGLVLALARDLAEHGIRVNAVAPGPVALPGEDHPALPPGVAVSTPDEVAEAVLALAAGHTDQTGQVVVVNGGLP